MKDHTAAHEFSATSPRVHLSVKNLGIWGMLQLRTEIESHNYFRFKTPHISVKGPEARARHRASCRRLEGADCVHLNSMLCFLTLRHTR